jgi:hypothetical protein
MATKYVLIFVALFNFSTGLDVFQIRQQTQSSGRWTEMAASPVVLLRKPLLRLATKTRPA